MINKSSHKAIKLPENLVEKGPMERYKVLSKPLRENALKMELKALLNTSQFPQKPFSLPHSP